MSKFAPTTCAPVLTTDRPLHKQSSIILYVRDDYELGPHRNLKNLIFILSFTKIFKQISKLSTPAG